jgi:hypothetical protein
LRTSASNPRRLRGLIVERVEEEIQRMKALGEI